MLNDAGRMVQSEWIRLTKRFRNIRLHTFIVMPNHFHAIIEIIETTPVGSSLVGDPEFAGKDNEKIRISAGTSVCLLPQRHYWFSAERKKSLPQRMKIS